MSQQVGTPSTNTSNVVIKRESLTIPLEQRYNKSKIREKNAPVRVDFLGNTFAKGFILNQKQGQTAHTGKLSQFVVNADVRKYTDRQGSR